MTSRKSMGVTRTSTVRAAMVAALSLLLTSNLATAKPRHCRKDCKQDIGHCRALVPTNADCAGTKAERRACRTMHAAQGRACHGLVKLCKQTNPNGSGMCLLPSTTTTVVTTTSTSTTTTSTTILGCGMFVTAWGTYGTGVGQFNYPFGVAVDLNGNVFVTDALNHRIQKFTNDGTFVRAWGGMGSD